MANPSLQIGNDNWAIKEDNLLGYSTAGTRFVPQPITMTRATLGTRVNPSGLVEDVALLGSELVTNGDFASDSDWNKTGTWSIESNYATASGNSTSQYIQQDFTITNGKTYLFTYEIIENTLNGNGSSLSGSGGFVSVSLSSVIGTHQVYITADDSGAAYALKIGVSGTATTGTIKLDNVSVKEATIDNLPRVDYTDGTSSLLVEPQRTNLITYSEDFSGSSWNKSYVTVTSDSVNSLDGNLNADLILETSAADRHIFWDNTNVSGGDYTVSIFLKKQNNRYVFFQSGVDNATDRYGIIYDFDGGVVTDTNSKGSPTNTSYKVEQHINGWVKLSITQTHTSGDVYLICGGSDSAIPTYNIQKEPVYTGNASNGFYAWGAQLEEGSYPTSYIKTSGSTVTRNQETYTKTGISDKINSEEGVLFVEMAALADDETFRYVSLTDGTGSNCIRLYYTTTSNSITYQVRFGGSLEVLNTVAVSDITNFNKIAVKWKLNDFAMWIGGVEVATDTSGQTPVGMNRLGFDSSGGGGPLFGKVKQLQIFKTALSNSELATLTT